VKQSWRSILVAVRAVVASLESNVPVAVDPLELEAIVIAVADVVQVVPPLTRYCRAPVTTAPLPGGGAEPEIAKVPVDGLLLGGVNKAAPVPRPNPYETAEE
jgi:hypothetical protein